MISPSLGLRSPARYPHLLLKCQRKTIPGEMSESGTPAALRCTAQCIPQLTKLREALKSCAKCCAAAGAMELATLREELKLRKMLRYCRRNGTQQSKVFGPYFGLRALLCLPCRTLQRVPFSSRLQETPKIQTVPSMSPSYRFRRLAVPSHRRFLPTVTI